jgi:hypothetical protein
MVPERLDRCRTLLEQAFEDLVGRLSATAATWHNYDRRQEYGAPEFLHGVTDWWEVGLYLPIAIQDQKYVAIRGWSLLLCPML